MRRGGAVSWGSIYTPIPIVNLRLDELETWRTLERGVSVFNGAVQNVYVKERSTSVPTSATMGLACTSLRSLRCRPE